MVEVQIADAFVGVLNNHDDGIESKPFSYQEYEPHKTPPDFEMAIRHGKAKRVYKQVRKHNRDETDEMHSNKICPCCALEIGGEQLSLRCKLENIYHLGSGFALYFKFTIYCIFMMAIIFIISGFYNLITNHMGNACTDPNEDSSATFCVKNFVIAGSLADKRDDQDFIRLQLVLNVIAVFVMILFLHYIRYKARMTHIETDQKTISPSDYTVLLKKVDSKSTSQEIKEWIEAFGTEEFPVQVEKIVRAYDIREYISLREEKIHLKEQKEEAESQNLQVLDEKLQEVKQKIKEYKVQGLKYTEEVFVTFTIAAHADFIVKKLTKTFLNRTLSMVSRRLHHKASVSNLIDMKAFRAPEPTDILWENMGYSEKEKSRKKLLTSLVAAVLIIAGFALIVGITWVQMVAAAKWEEETTVLSLLALTVSLFIFVINFLLANTIKFLADYEKHITLTRYYTGIADKLSISMFINTAFTTLFAKMVLGYAFYKSSGFRSYLKFINFYNQGGLLESIFYIVVTGALLVPFLTIVDPAYIIQLFNRQRELKKGAASELTQRDAHKLFEGPQMDMATKYANLIKTMLLVGFYAPALPSVLILASIGLILTYWADKYILLRRIGLPNSMDNDLTKLMVEYLEWTPFMYALGNLVFIYTLENSQLNPVYNTVELWLMWMTLFISLVSTFAPMEAINQKIFQKEKIITETLTYKEAQKSFITDYDIENPITRKRALKEFLTSSISQKKDFQTSKGLSILIHNLAPEILKATNDLEKSEHLVEEEEEEHEDTYDLKFLNMYAANVKKRPIKEVEQAPEEVFTEYTVESAKLTQRVEEDAVKLSKGASNQSLHEKKPEEEEEDEFVNDETKPLVK